MQRAQISDKRQEKISALNTFATNVMLHVCDVLHKIFDLATFIAFYVCISVNTRCIEYSYYKYNELSI